MSEMSQDFEDEDDLAGYSYDEDDDGAEEPDLDEDEDGYHFETDKEVISTLRKVIAMWRLRIPASLGTEPHHDDLLSPH